MTGGSIGLLGLGVVLVSALLMLVLTLFFRKSPPTFRNISAYSRLRRAVGRVVEDGSRLHVSLGHGSLTSPQSASALAGLALLRRLSEMTSTGDQTPIATAGDPTLAILSQDTLQAASQASVGGVYDPTAGRLAGLTPFSYAAGAAVTLHDDNVSTHAFIGNFGVEAGLLTEAAERQGAFNVAASDNLTAQAVMYASAQEPLVGEELYAAGAYLGAGPLHVSSLVVQDILRWVIILVILGGAALKLAGLL